MRAIVRMVLLWMNILGLGLTLYGAEHRFLLPLIGAALNGCAIGTLAFILVTE